MKRYSSIFILLLIVVIGNSCKKKYPDPPASGSPVFVFNGSINSSPTNLQAGVNDYYMFTSHVLDLNGVYDLAGEFKDVSCTSNCTNALKISIKDYRQYSPNATTIDSSLVMGYYNYFSTSGAACKYYVAFFDTLLDGTAQSYSWDFGDGNTANVHRPVHVYLHPGIYDVTFHTVSSNSCTSSLTNKVMVGNQLGDPIMMVYGSSTTSNNVSFSSSVGGGTGPYNYLWDFGDSYTSTTPVSLSHQYSSAGVYQTSLTVTDAVGATAVFHQNSATWNPGTCHSNFYPLATTAINNPLNLADVLIEWRDASGTVWTSAGNTQPVGSMFKIISIDNYLTNVNGQPTKKIHARIICKLFNGSNSIPITGDVVFAVAYQ